jgi:hypothetical protein
VILQQKELQKPSGRIFFLSNNEQFPPNKGAIMTNATIIKAVMLLAAEAELGALFLNAKEEPSRIGTGTCSGTVIPMPVWGSVNF